MPSFRRDYSKYRRVLLCLSGGGFRMMEVGAGVLQALEQLHIPISAYRAASAGSVIAGMNASGLSGNAIEALIRSSPANTLISKHWATMLIPFYRSRSLYSRKGIETLLKGSINDQLIKDKVTVSVTEEDSLKSCVMQGSFDSILASSAIPEVFDPVIINCISYVDGGVKNNIPTPKIIEIPNWDLIIIVMCSDSSQVFTSAFKISRAIKWFEATMDREFSQVSDDWEGVPNAVIIQPPTPSFSTDLLDWSDKFQLINYSREYALSML